MTTMSSESISVFKLRFKRKDFKQSSNLILLLKVGVLVL